MVGYEGPAHIGQMEPIRTPHPLRVRETPYSLLGRSPAGRRLSVEMAAIGDDHAEQPFAAGGAIQVRRR
jgi:hypothetical protein